ncbi:MAG: ribose-5-phosphate isomerase RpiA [Halobacterium sp.]
MKQSGGSDDAKRRAGEAAADEVADGMVVGLGTGSTAAHAIRALGERDVDVAGVPTSFQSRQLAIEAGIPVTSLEEASVDVAIDGADQVAGGDLVKGGGAAHAREKYVDANADRFVVVADPSKEADVLEHPVPVEVLPDAHSVVADRVRELDGDPSLRAADRKDGPVVTDNGNLVLDCEFGRIEDPEGLAAALSAVPGVVEHGLFVGLADAVYVGTGDGVRQTEL